MTELRRVVASWRRHRAFVAGGAVVSLLILLTLVSQLYTPHDPEAVEIGNRLRPPGATHLLGTDQFGRDTLSRVLRGASIALMVAGVSVAISLALGVALGAIAGYAGGWTDEIIMRAMDGLLAFPALLLAIAVVAALGPGHRNAAIAIMTSLSIGRAILAEAGLSYLGLGTQPPLPSWGKMLQEAQGFLTLSPWMAAFPGLAIAVTVLAFNLLGDALRDLLDPRLR